MAPSIGVNLRVTGHSSQGGRKYMEDVFSVAYQSTPDEQDLEYAFFGIFDGHGGRDAAQFAKENLLTYITKQKLFWSDKDEDIMKAIREGFLATHQAMWSEIEKWPRTASGMLSTSGTTASVVFLRRGKMYIGHVGDSGIILGQSNNRNDLWTAIPLTKEHKPECEVESERINNAGGKVISKMGVPRVVWNRPKPGHKGPIRRSTPIDEVPFLAVARSLGDLWSHNREQNTFVVSPEPDVTVHPADPNIHRCLILGTDGLWNVLTPEKAVNAIQMFDIKNSNEANQWRNPSQGLVDLALYEWSRSRVRADNTTCVTLMFDPPGPPVFRPVVKNSRSGNRLSTSPQKGAAVVDHDYVDNANDVVDSSRYKEVANMLLGEALVKPIPMEIDEEVAHNSHHNTRSTDKPSPTKRKALATTSETVPNKKQRSILTERRVQDSMKCGRTARLLSPPAKRSEPPPVVKRELRSSSIPPKRTRGSSRTG